MSFFLYKPPSCSFHSPQSLCYFSFTAICLTASYTLSCSMTAAKPIQVAAIALESSHHVYSRHCLTASMLGGCQCVSHHLFEEHLSDGTSFLVHQSRYALYSPAPDKTLDSSLGDTLDVVAKYCTVTIIAPLPDSPTSSAPSTCGFLCLFHLALHFALVSFAFLRALCRGEGARISGEDAAARHPKFGIPVGGFSHCMGGLGVPRVV